VHGFLALDIPISQARGLPAAADIIGVLSFQWRMRLRDGDSDGVEDREWPRRGSKIMVCEETTMALRFVS
jgi:hypothetical protein